MQVVSSGARRGRRRRARGRGGHGLRPRDGECEEEAELGHLRISTIQAARVSCRVAPAGGGDLEELRRGPGRGELNEEAHLHERPAGGCELQAWDRARGELQGVGSCPAGRCKLQKRFWLFLYIF